MVSGVLFNRPHAGDNENKIQKLVLRPKVHLFTDAKSRTSTCRRTTRRAVSAVGRTQQWHPVGGGGGAPLPPRPGQDTRAAARE